MAGRPLKEGLDYASWDVGILDGDERIDELIDSQGIAAFTVYFYLVNKAYATHGYYLDWGYHLCATTARRLGRGACAEFVRNCVEMCLQIGLFDKGLFAECGILTSRGIQKRYWEVAKNRQGRGERRKYWLLDPPPKKEENAEGLVPYTKNANYEPPKCDYEPPKCDSSKGTERKYTLSLARPRGKHQNVMLTDEQYEDIKRRIPEADAYIEAFSAKLHDRGYTYADHYATLLSWWESDRKRSRRKNKGVYLSGNFDAEEFFNRAVNHGRPKPKGNENG